ncbi:hypothetical protein O0L34_g14121 [Tuta absoluta]|nr:hypothetical protein O0L34_g14121 [Tuta absoluta]
MICMCILHLLAFLVTSTKLDVPYEDMYFIKIDQNGNIINNILYEHDKDRVDETAKVFRGGNIYYLDTRRKKFKMSKLERGEAIKHLYEKYEQEPKPNKTTDLFDQVREWNKKQGFISKGTCDRRNRKVCKNACRKVYRRICNEIKCKSVFKEEIKKNCAKICNLEFKQEFG